MRMSHPGAEGSGKPGADISPETCGRIGDEHPENTPRSANALPLGGRLAMRGGRPELLEAMNSGLEPGRACSAVEGSNHSSTLEPQSGVLRNQSNVFPAKKVLSCVPFWPAE